MHALRTSLTLARLILAWFALTLGVAVASPLVQPHQMELVCAEDGGVKLVVVGEDGQAAPVGHHSLDCPMCLPVMVPAPVFSLDAAMPHPLAHALRPVAAAHIAALVGAPLPARGPPRA